MNRKSNRLAGHELPFEGKASRMNAHGVVVPAWEPVGHTYCSCGEPSPKFPSDNARKRWHREHKDQIRVRMSGGKSS